MRFMQMEAATCLVREKGFNPKPFRIQVTRLVCRGHIREQIQRVFIPFGPATEEPERTIGFFRYAHIPQRDQGPWLDARGHGLAPEVLAIPRDGDVAPRPIAR